MTRLTFLNWIITVIVVTVVQRTFIRFFSREHLTFYIAYGVTTSIIFYIFYKFYRVNKNKDKQIKLPLAITIIIVLFLLFMEISDFIAPFVK